MGMSGAIDEWKILLFIYYICMNISVPFHINFHLGKNYLLDQCLLDNANEMAKYMNKYKKNILKRLRILSKKKRCTFESIPRGITLELEQIF